MPPASGSDRNATITMVDQNCMHSATNRSNTFTPTICPVMAFSACVSPTPVMKQVMTAPRNSIISVEKNTFWISRNATPPGRASKYTAHAAEIFASGSTDVTRNDVTNATAKLIAQNTGSICGTPCAIVRHRHRIAATIREKNRPYTM